MVYLQMKLWTDRMTALRSNCVAIDPLLRLSSQYNGDSNRITTCQCNWPPASGED